MNTSKLYRMEQFVDHFPEEEAHMTGEDIHKRLDEIEEIHALYSPAKLGLPQLLPVAVLLFYSEADRLRWLLLLLPPGIGNLIRTKLIKHHYTLFLNIAVSVFSSMFYLCSLSETCGTCLFTFRNFMKLVISARCCSSSRDFHLLQAGSTLQDWICVRDWSGLLMQSLSLWLPLYLHGSWLYFCVWNRPFSALHLSAVARLIFRVIASFAEYSVSRSCSTVLIRWRQRLHLLVPLPIHSGLNLLISHICLRPPPHLSGL